MSQHDEKIEVDLIKGIRAAKDAGDHETRNRLGAMLRRLYENDADQFAKRYVGRDDIERGNLRGKLLEWLETSVRKYDCEKYSSFCEYVVWGWKGFAVREFFQEGRVTESIVKRIPRSKIQSIDSPMSNDEVSSTLSEMLPDPREGQDESDGRDFLEWLCSQFGVVDLSQKDALLHTINRDASPAARRIGLSILSRQIEHRPSISRFWASRFWADAATRRRLWRELAASIPVRG